MKKVLCFLVALILLGLSLLGVTAYSLVRESDNVTFTVIDEWGDRGYLEGISAEMSFTMLGRLNWDVTFTPFEAVETEYAFTDYPQTDNSYYQNYGIGMPSLGLLQLKNINPKLKQLVEELRTEALNAGTTASAAIKFCDYYEYYPVNINIGLPGIRIEWQNGFGVDEAGKYEFSGISPSRGQGVLDAINDFLRIPVKETDMREISVMSNNIGSFSYHSACENSFDFCFYSVSTDSHLYFTFENEINTGHEEKRELIDTSLIPGGYGIYSLPYTEKDIKYEELKTVYSISSDATVESLSVDEERQELYLGLHENEKYMLHIIDMNTMTDKTVLELFDFSFEDFIRTEQNEDFFVFIKNDIDFNVVAINDSGMWEAALTGSVPAEGPFVREYLSYSSHFGFDGERLVVWDFDSFGFLSLQPDVMVFTRDGLQYYCNWLCSLGDPVARASRWESVSVEDWKIIIE